jgi:prevent-host-death family protein
MGGAYLQAGGRRFDPGHVHQFHPNVYADSSQIRRSRRVNRTRIGNLKILLVAPRPHLWHSTYYHYILGERMEKPVSAAAANRTFSKLLRAVREGQSYIVTSHGEAVAKIIPAEKHGGEMRGARVALLRRLRAEPVVKIGRWTRDELYEERT